MGFADEMAEHDEEFEQAQEKERPQRGSYNQLPDGKHQAMIDICRVAKYDERWVFEINFTRPEGTVRKFNGLDSDVGRDIAAMDSAMLGYKGKLSGLEDWCRQESAIGALCDINIRTKPGDGRDFTNVYLNRVLGLVPDDERSNWEFEQSAAADPDNQYVPAGAAAGVDPDDDIPF